MGRAYKAVDHSATLATPPTAADGKCSRIEKPAGDIIDRRVRVGPGSAS